MRKNQQDANQHKTAKPGTGNKSPAAAKKRAPKKVKEATQAPQAEPILADTPNTPATENKMEVHHHPQLEHNPKPWKEYLLEGFMIFIAVMMGFIAENIRENITNSEHAKQLTVQLVRDLKADMVALKGAYDGEVRITATNDSLINLLQQPVTKADNKLIQKYVGASHSLYPFHPSMGVINAIKNELHLKQFSESDIIRYMSKYEAHVELLRTVQNITLEYQRKYLDPFMVDHFTPANINAALYHHPLTGDATHNLTQGDLSQLAAQMVLVRVNSNELALDNHMLLDDAEEMLKYIKKQYGINE